MPKARPFEANDGEKMGRAKWWAAGNKGKGKEKEESGAAATPTVAATQREKGEVQKRESEPLGTLNRVDK